jgi:hypothetical protein
MEIFVIIVTTLWAGLMVVSLDTLLHTIFGNEYEKKDVVKHLAAFVVATITTIALFAFALYIKFNI